MIVVLHIALSMIPSSLYSDGQTAGDQHRNQGTHGLLSGRVCDGSSLDTGIHDIYMDLLPLSDV